MFISNDCTIIAMIVLDKWQEEVSNATGDILLCTGRRVGKTYIMGKKGIDRMVKEKTPIIVMSLTEDQAYIMIIMAWNYLEQGYPEIWKKSKRTMRQITLPNGSVMISRPAGDTGDGVRGFEGGVLIVDEASRMPKLFWIAAKPILLTTGGDIWMCSTPHGKQGYFWKRFDEAYNKKKKDARFKVFYVTTPDVVKNRPINGDWTQKIRDGALRVLREDKNEMTTLQYGQEYLGQFLDELQQFFPDALIKSCQLLERPGIEIRGKYYLGVDIARMGRDKSTFEIIDRRDRDNLKHVENIVTGKTLTTETTKKILQLEDSYKFRQIFIDAYNVGTGVFDQLLSDNRTKRKTVAINHYSRPLDNEEKQRTKLTKADIYNNLLNLMERGKIKLLKGDAIFDSLASIQYEYKDGGKMEIFGSDAHIADGLVRAAYCSGERKLDPYIF